MRRAKRATAAILCLLTVFSAAPVRAAEIVRAVELSAPAPVPVFLLPAALAAPSISPTPAAAATSFGLAPAPAALLAVPALAAPAAPLAAAAAGIPAAAAPALAAPIRASAAEALRAAAPQAALDSGRLFDGGRSLPAAADAEPVLAPSASSSAGTPLPPAVPRKAKRPLSPTRRFLRAAVVGVGASTLIPLLWSAIPSAGALTLFAVAALPVAAAMTVMMAVGAVRAVSRRLTGAVAAPAAPSSRRAVNTIRALGFAVGLALTAATAINQIPIIEHVDAYMNSRLPASEREFKTEIPGKYFGAETARVLSRTPEGRAALDRVRGRDGVVHMPAFSVSETRQRDVALRGSFFADSTAKTLSRTAVGREILDGLRDRGGVLRMPTFFVSYQKGSAAQYSPPDAVFLSVETIEEGGVTVDQFLRDHKIQLDYLEREQAIVAHELKHADQARRWPLDADTWVMLKTNGGRLVAAVEAYASGRSAPSAAGGAGRASDAAQAKAAAPAGAAAATIVIDAAALHRDGLTVGRFVSDQQAQKEYIVRHQAELAAALKPVAEPPAAAPTSPIAVLKNAPAAPGSVPATAPAVKAASFDANFGMIQEWEYEAYITEHHYTHERLTADPAVAMSNGELWNYESRLGDFDSFLKSIDDGKIYSANFHAVSSHYARYMAKERAGWDAYRVEGYVLLARRALAQGAPVMARSYLAQARDIAKEKGLPAPTFVVPSK